MRDNCFLSTVAVACFFLAAFQNCPGQSTNSKSPSELKRFELGGHYTVMFQDDFEPSDVVFERFGFTDRPIIDRRYESGFGGGLPTTSVPV